MMKRSLRNAIPHTGNLRFPIVSTKTTTAVTHYHIQKKRRKEFLEEWRKNRRTVIRKEDVALKPTARGMRSGVYMGWDGDSPTRCLDALLHEIDPGVTTTIHRHSWDAQTFVVEGSGYELMFMEHERDTGLRKCAYESLKSATGKDLPAKAEVWSRALHPERGGGRLDDAPPNPTTTVWDYLLWPIRLVRGS